jgi:hypothetical protein
MRLLRVIPSATCPATMMLNGYTVLSRKRPADHSVAANDFSAPGTVKLYLREP